VGGGGGGWGECQGETAIGSNGDETIDGGHLIFNFELNVAVMHETE
jgi:hypothetical protein